MNTEVLERATPALPAQPKLANYHASRAIFAPIVALPEGFGWEHRYISELSTTTAFVTGTHNRDVFRGCCVVCGDYDLIEQCHILPQSEPDVVSAAVMLAFDHTNGMGRAVARA